MNGYIYLNFSDLSEKSQEKIKNIAYDYVNEETTQEEADYLRMTLDDLIDEKIEKKLIDWSAQGKFIFNY